MKLKVSTVKNVETSTGVMPLKPKIVKVSSAEIFLSVQALSIVTGPIF